MRRFDEVLYDSHANIQIRYLSWVIYQKYVNAIPLYHQKRAGNGLDARSAEQQWQTGLSDEAKIISTNSSREPV